MLGKTAITHTAQPPNFILKGLFEQMTLHRKFNPLFTRIDFKIAALDQFNQFGHIFKLGIINQIAHLNLRHSQYQ